MIPKGENMKILRLSFANIKKHRKESILFMILITFGIILLAASVSSVLGIKQITPKMVEESGCFKNFVYIKQDNYSDIYLEFLKENDQIESFNHTSFVSDNIKVRTKDEGDILADISFVPLNGECRMESFEPDHEFRTAAHPIVLASAFCMKRSPGLACSNAKRTNSTASSRFIRNRVMLGSVIVIGFPAWI
jgi:hypothetical protein